MHHEDKMRITFPVRVMREIVFKLTNCIIGDYVIYDNNKLFTELHQFDNLMIGDKVFELLQRSVFSSHYIYSGYEEHFLAHIDLNLLADQQFSDGFLAMSVAFDASSIQDAELSVIPLDRIVNNYNVLEEWLVKEHLWKDFEPTSIAQEKRCLTPVTFTISHIPIWRDEEESDET